MSELYRAYSELFKKGGLRVAEVAAILNVHRVTASRWRHHKEPIDICDEATKSRILAVSALAKLAIKAGHFPLDKDSVKGKNNRLVTIKRVLLFHSKSSS